MGSTALEENLHPEKALSPGSSALPPGLCQTFHVARHESLAFLVQLTVLIPWVLPMGAARWLRDLKEGLGPL